MLSNILRKLTPYGSGLLHYIKRLGFGVRYLILCRKISIIDFLRFCIRTPNVVICLITQKDLTLLDAHLPSAPYRTHSDDLADQEAGIISMAIAWLYGYPVGQGIIRWLGPQEVTVSEKLGPIPEILRLYVKRELRSYGIGTQLVQFLEQLARSRGYASIGLGVSMKNPKARAFYKRIGYTSSGIIYIEEWDYPDKNGLPIHVREENEFLIKNLT